MRSRNERRRGNSDNVECNGQEWDIYPGVGLAVRGKMRLNKLGSYCPVPVAENGELKGIGNSIVSRA